MSETRSKKQRSLVFTIETPLGRPKCHYRPWWPILDPNSYLLNNKFYRHRVKSKPLFKYTLETPWVEYSTNIGPGGQILN